jgi:DNA-binding XRE family transcriptional regulator
MADRASETDTVKRLSAAVLELRAELMVTQAALAAALAEIARGADDPSGTLAQSVARMLGFADAAAAGLQGQPGARPRVATDSALRMADWAEGLLAAEA